jgi:hypothetical protein
LEDQVQRFKPNSTTLKDYSTFYGGDVEIAFSECRTSVFKMLKQNNTVLRKMLDLIAVSRWSEIKHLGTEGSVSTVPEMSKNESESETDDAKRTLLDLRDANRNDGRTKTTVDGVMYFVVNLFFKFR